MKLKYYTKLIFKNIFYSIFLILLFTNISTSQILTSGVSPQSIFKCGESTIFATFDDGGIVSVDAIVAATETVQPMIVGRAGQNRPEMATNIIVPLTFNGTNWIGTFGNDPTMLWGTRSITYSINSGATTYLSSSTIFVYNSGSTCSGTGKNSLNNYTRGFGTYTNNLATGVVSPLEFPFYPWIQYWGYLFYVVVIFVTISSIYLKSQNVMPVIYTIIVFLLILSVSGVIPVIFRQPMLFLIGGIIGIILYRVFTRD